MCVAYAQAYFFDSGCQGAHYFSPDGFQCASELLGPDSGFDSDSVGRTYAEDGNLAIGYFSGASNNYYVYGHPWRLTSMKRSPGWHKLTFFSTSQELYIDDQLVSALDSPVYGRPLDNFGIHGGQFSSDPTKNSTAYWDQLIIVDWPFDLPYIKANLSKLEPIFRPINNATTVQLPSQGVTPRYGHTITQAPNAMYLFGGERSGYEYPDLWTSEPTLWSSIFPEGSASPPGRHYHSAVWYEGSLYVYGGRRYDEVLGDLWKYSEASNTWAQIYVPQGLPGRFAHTASVIGGKMYVFGGYSKANRTEDGAISNDLISFEFATGTWTLIGPRTFNYNESFVKDPADAIIFPASFPAPRYHHSAVVVKGE